MQISNTECRECLCICSCYSLQRMPSVLSRALRLPTVRVARNTNVREFRERSRDIMSQSDFGSSLIQILIQPIPYLEHLGDRGQLPKLVWLEQLLLLQLLQPPPPPPMQPPPLPPMQPLALSTVRVAGNTKVITLAIWRSSYMHLSSRLQCLLPWQHLDLPQQLLDLPQQLLDLPQQLLDL
jgi:hypothetical protein